MKNLLLVEDDPTISTLLTDLLTEKGYSVCHIDNGLKALEIVQEQSFDLILLDQNLPQMNGSEILIKIKANPDINHTPIIMLTSVDDDDFQINVFNEGVDDYIKKPFRMNLLLARINSVLRRSEISKPALSLQLPDGADIDHINPREKEVLAYIVKGYNNQQIAKDLFISEATVAKHLKSIFSKLKTTNRTQTAMIAVKYNLFKPV